jgi:hypothetical protein
MRHSPFLDPRALLFCLLSLPCALPAHAQEPPAPGAAEEEEKEQRRSVSHSSSLGLDTARVQRGATALPSDSPDQQAESTEIRFSSSGFIRAPARVSIGPSQNVDPGVERGTKIHTPPILPDDNYTDWRFLNSNYTPWAEVRLTYGNDIASATVAFAAIDINDSSYRNFRGQLGINEAFVTLKLPKLLGPRGGIHWNVGAFSNGYGTAGQYDTGKYDTYLFGATHVAGETLHISYDVADDWTVRVEHGIGAKLDMPKFGPDYIVAQQTTDDHNKYATNPYLPYVGPQQPGGTLVNHAHLGVTWKGMLTLAGHYLTSWTDDARSAAGLDGAIEKDARITIYGGELKLVGSRIGSGYLGYAHLDSKNPVREAGGLESIHAFQGYMLRDIYFDDLDHHLENDYADPQATGTGTIDTVLFQHVFSVSTFIQGTEKFWGQGPDLLFSIFGMYNHIASDDPNFRGAEDRLKLGADVAYVPIKWLSGGVRYDNVQPNMKDNTKSFQAIAPRLVFRSSFVSNEEIQLQYTYYMYGDAVYAPWPDEQQLLVDGTRRRVKPDPHAIMLSASMWWE